MRVHNPTFSVVLVVKNALPLVVGTLESLKYQTFTDFEVVVADGVSTDGTVDALNAAAAELPLRIVSEPDRNLADAYAKALSRVTGDYVGFLSADERYYPHALEQIAKWFEADPDAVVVSGKVDFIDNDDRIVDSYLAAPFDLAAHLACENVPSILPTFFNRRLIGDDLRFDSSVPTCPDYDFWARLGFRFPPATFKSYDVGIAQAYRTRDSMSFRAESFDQFCRDKLTHLNNLLARGYAGARHEALRRRASAGIHMWAAEQLRFIDRDHPDILGHCAEAARHDKSYERIAAFVEMTGKARYDAETGIITRTGAETVGPRAKAIAVFSHEPPLSYWEGAAVLSRDPLTVRTSSAPWGLSMELLVPERALAAFAEVTTGRFWARLDLEVVEGAVGVSLGSRDEELTGEMIFRPSDGRTVALIGIHVSQIPSLVVRSAGHPASVLRIYRAELLYDPDRQGGALRRIAPDAQRRNTTQPPSPPRPGRVEDGLVDISTMRTYKYWVGASLSHQDRVRLNTAPSQWAYSASLPISLRDHVRSDRYYWVGLRLRVQKGAIGLALSKNGAMVGAEVYATADDRDTDVWIPIGDPEADSIIIRNTFAEGASETEIASAHVESLGIEEGVAP